MIKDLLIHTCCADCLLNLLYALEQDAQISKNTNLTLLFYNPNIHPRTEYMERLKALKQVIEQGKITQNVKLVIPGYRPKEYFESIALESSRCVGCWKIRMKSLLDYAEANNFFYLSSTLLSSHYQDSGMIKKIVNDLKKPEQEIIAPQKEYEHIQTGGFYKQNFCGCCFSLVERLSEKYKK